MKGWILGGILVAALFGGARPARACGQGGGLAEAFAVLLVGSAAVATVGGDIAFTLGDAMVAGEGKRPPVVWGVGEALLAAPQAALLGWSTYTDLQAGHTEYTAATGALTLWTAGLTAHGVYTIVRARSTWQSTGPERPVAWQVAPAMVSAGPSQPAPGAVVFGRF